VEVAVPVETAPASQQVAVQAGEAAQPAAAGEAAVAAVQLG
jgi:hypothetical protein